MRHFCIPAAKTALQTDALEGKTNPSPLQPKPQWQGTTLLTPRLRARSPTSAGLSLPELLVSLALFSFLLSAITKILIEGLNFFTVQSISLETQQQAMVAMKWLESDLQGASRQSFRSTPEGLIFGSRQNQDGKIHIDNGFLAWQKFLCYYVIQHDHTMVLQRKQRPLSPPSFAPPPVPTSLTPQSFIDDDSHPRILARHVEHLTASDSNPTKVELKANYGQGSFVMTVHTEIALDDETSL